MSCGSPMRVRAGYLLIWLPCLCAAGPGHHVWICAQCDVATYVPQHSNYELECGGFGSLYSN